MPLNEKYRKILKTLDESNVPLKPKEISQTTGLNHSTVRNYLRDLHKNALVYQPYPGAYNSSATYGVGNETLPVMVHNLRMVSSWPKEYKIKNIPESNFSIGSVKVKYVFGMKRKKITCTIKHDEGIPEKILLTIIRRVYRDYINNFGVLPEFECSFHLNRDYKGVELDGVTCATIYDLCGFVSRIYQKGEKVRAEYIHKGLSPSDMLSLVQGSYSYEPRLRKIEQVLKEISEKSDMIIGQHSMIYKKKRGSKKE